MPTVLNSLGFHERAASMGTGIDKAGNPARLAGTVSTSSAKVSTESFEDTDSSVGGRDCAVGVTRKSTPCSGAIELAGGIRG